MTSLFYLICGIILLLLGIVIFRENPRQRINRVTGVMMILAGTGPIFGAFGLLLSHASATRIDLGFFRKVFLIWEFFFPQLLLFSLYFPRESKWIRRHAWLPFMIFLPHLIHFVIVFIFSSPEQVRSIIDLQPLVERFGVIAQPVVILLGLGLLFLSLIYKFHTNFFALINLIYIVLAIILMMLGYRRLTNLRMKKQVGFVLWGIRVSMGLYAIAFIFPALNLIHTSQAISHLLTSGALLIGAGSIAWAIIRYQFLDIRLIIRRGLIFSFTSALIVGLYLLTYTQGKKWIQGTLGIDIPILEIILIILALFAFQPIFNLSEKVFDRIFLRERSDYRNVLQELSHSIMTTFDINKLVLKITSTLREAMALENVELILPNRDGTFSLETGEARYQWKPNEEWIKILQSKAEPTGFDEISLLVKDDKSLEKLRKLNAFLIVPLIYRENLSGILMLGEKTTRTHFTAEEMTVLSVLSSQAAIAFENAHLHQDILEKQRMEEELRLAREIQQNLLPNICPSGDYFELVGYNLPSKEVGGDYYDFIPLANDRIGIAIGDISGKGIPAAILMSNLQASLRISANQATRCSDVVSQVNGQISKTTSIEKFATFFYGIFDSKTHTFEYTNAGHNYPILWRKNGSYDLLKEGGLIIGVIEKTEYQTREVQLHTGDTLLLYTDGITESMNPSGEEFGEERLLNCLARMDQDSAQGVLENVLTEVTAFSQGDLYSDDLTLVVLRVK
jgi:sigma-B regulation protein RsbU (phosphoserine phosphatase)